MAPGDDEIERLLRDHVAANGDVSHAEFCRVHGLSTSRVRRAFGSWRALRERIGLPPRRGARRAQHSNDEVVAALKRVAAVEGADVTLKTFRAATGYSTSLVQSRFGSWPALRRAAGLPSRTGDPRRRHSDADLLDELHRLWRQLGRFPRWSEIARLGSHAPSTYARRLAPRRKALFEATARHALGQRIDTLRGPNHPHRAALVEVALENLYALTRKDRSRRSRR